MAKQLKDILKAASDTIKGVRPSTTTDLSLGKDPGVDYDPKAKDEQDFVAKHSVQKWDDPNGNGSDVFQATNVNHSQVSHAHGYKPPKDKKVNEESFDEAWIVTHKDGKVTTHAGQKDAMSASKKSPGSKVSATHGAMGQKAHDVLSPHQRSDMGTFSAAGYTPPEKKKKLKEAAKCNMTEAGKMCEVHGLKECWKESTHMNKEEVENIEEMPTQYRSTAGMGAKRGWASKKAARVAFQNPQPLREPGTKRADKASGDAAVAAHLASGGKITQLPPGRAKGVRKEEVEQVDEVLTKKDPASTWIRDFIKSKDPKFAGKSKKERQRMALGAYYAKQRNESVEEDLAVPLLGGDDHDESAEMAKAQLKALAAKANALADQLSDDLMIEPWVQSKIAVAKDYVTSVHDYMIYGEHDKNNEQTGPDTPMTFPNMSVDVNTGRNV